MQLSFASQRKESLHAGSHHVHSSSFIFLVSVTLSRPAGADARSGDARRVSQPQPFEHERSMKLSLTAALWLKIRLDKLINGKRLWIPFWIAYFYLEQSNFEIDQSNDIT